MSKLFFPNKCIFCGKIIPEEKMICSECIKTVYVVGDNTCDYCGRDLENCGCKIGDFAFARNISYFYYKNSIKTLMYRYKFGKKHHISKDMSKYMVSKISDKYKDFTFDFVTFVPMSRIKLSFRGFNPAKLLAENIAEQMQLPVLETLGSKFRIKSSKALSKKDRRKKIRGRFFLKTASLENKHILLVDDIMTTGNTLSECARMLKKAGAKEISCVTFAITTKK